MSISDNHNYEPIPPAAFPRREGNVDQFCMCRKPARLYIELYVLPWEMADASINLYGRGGTRICSLKDLQDFNYIAVDRSGAGRVYPF